MKTLILIFTLLLYPTQDETMKDIGTAMKAGSSKELIKFCNNTVEIKINGESSNYSRSQAEVILRDFFNKNSPKSFTYIHQGSSPEGLKYTIGRYTHNDGAYRVVMFIKKIGDNYLIDTLNFSQE
ncbi:protein of unknown function [Ekhidna lutea]|uniref:DUF4783 domain-containing protein n=1 Tax=Ekhidna lutea TaxID=447679 RepID=A0A239ESJ5_EKHLU|nr:DUF4783 domain-containing protein [Ekhidna lutea]SNS47730.1 protein of unknown function [Ekhidna lutea]